jgi:DNA-binding response OmpR family regulator
MANILIVEDDKVLNDAYTLILKDSGHNVTSTFDGEEALEHVKNHEPEIILLDLLMPRMNGLQFLEAYDVRGKHPNVKVVILSNLGNDNEIEKAIDLGAYKYIIKAHASPDDLSALVNHLIKKNLQSAAKV